MWKITDPFGIKARAERKRKEQARQDQERRERVAAMMKHMATRVNTRTYSPAPAAVRKPAYSRVVESAPSPSYDLYSTALLYGVLASDSSPSPAPEPDRFSSGGGGDFGGGGASSSWDSPACSPPPSDYSSGSDSGSCSSSDSSSSSSSSDW